MKIEKLNENKIKITLNQEDLSARNIDVQSFIYNTPESQDLFWDVMQEAEKEYGFKVDESMVYVEASATAAGIFTLTVTKNENPLNDVSTKNKIKNQNYKLKRKTANSPLNNSIYCFESFDDLCDFCKNSSLKDFGENSLFQFNSLFYLFISKVPNCNILEYAKKETNTRMILAKISEYGKVIFANNAINEVANLFIKKTSKSK